MIVAATITLLATALGLFVASALVARHMHAQWAQHWTDFQKARRQAETDMAEARRRCEDNITETYRQNREQVTDAWKQFGIEYQKMFLRRDEDNRRHYDDALAILKESVERSSRNHLSAIEALSAPANVRALAAVREDGVAKARVADAVDEIAGHVRGSFQAVSYGATPLPEPEEEDYEIPPIPVPSLNGSHK